MGRLSDPPTCSFPKHDIALAPLVVSVVDEEKYLKAGGRIGMLFSATESYPPDSGAGSVRPAGSIVGATVRVLDETGTWTKEKTQSSGEATVRTWPNLPKAVVVSMPGFATYSNSVGWLEISKFVSLRNTSEQK